VGWSRRRRARPIRRIQLHLDGVFGGHRRRHAADPRRIRHQLEEVFGSRRDARGRSAPDTASARRKSSAAIGGARGRSGRSID
jgi:hypothetical protein